MTTENLRYLEALLWEFLTEEATPRDEAHVLPLRERVRRMVSSRTRPLRTPR